MQTVGELKKFLENLPDDMLLVKRSDNFELRGAIDVGIYPLVEKFRVENQEFTDGFDYEKYHHDVYIQDETGKECLFLR